VRPQCREAALLRDAQRRLHLAQPHGQQPGLKLAASFKPARLGVRGVGAAVRGVGAAVRGELAFARLLAPRAQLRLLGRRLCSATPPLGRRPHLLVQRHCRRLEPQQQRRARARIRRALARLRRRRRAHRRGVFARRRRGLAARRGQLLEGVEMRRDLACHARLERRGELGEQLRLDPVPHYRLLQHSACGRVALGLLLELRELLVSLARRRELVLLQHEVRLLPLHLPRLLLVRASQRLEGGAQLGDGVALRVEPLLQQRDRRLLLVAQRALQHALVRPVLVGQ